MGPIDYTVDVQQPFQAALQGFQAGNAIRTTQLQQQQQEQALQQQQLAIQAQQQRQRDLYEIANNKNATGADYARVMTLHPELSEQLTKAWSAMNGEQQKSELSFRAQVFTALDSGNPEVASSILKQRAEAKRNSGSEEEAAKDEMMANLIAANPDIARLSVGTWLAGVPEGGKLIDAAQKLRLAPVEQRKLEAEAGGAEADAETKRITAKYADQKAVMDLQKQGWDIKKVVSDIETQREANRIAAMNASIARENNQLKREELIMKRDEARQTLDGKIRDRVAGYEAGQATLQDALNLLTELRADPDTLAAATGAGAWRGAIPGTKARTAAGKIEQLQNTLAAANLDKLKGAMSDKDIDFLKNIATNLDRYQDEDQFVKELGKIEQALIRGDKQLRQKYGAPTRPAPSVEPASTGNAQRNVTVDW